MKHLLLACSISALFIMSCNNNSGEKKNDKTGETKIVAPDYSASITDLSAIEDVKILLAQNWESKEDAQEAELSGGSTDLEMPYHGLSLFSDSTMVGNPRDNMSFGNWTTDGKDLITTFSDGSKKQLAIVTINAKTLILQSKENKKRMEYRADGKVQKKLADDPFYGTNNQWRVKPKKSETDEQIKKRVMDCVQFYHKLLLDKVAKSNNSVAIFVGLPEIFTFYNGSITVLRKEKLKSKWINCFYNQEQAIKAQVLLEDIITRKYNWDKKEPNWLKKDAAVLQQIYDNLAAAK